jgi:hypothetical protein
VLREGYQRLLSVSRHSLRTVAEAGEIADGIDTDREAAVLFFMVQGLIGPILIGVLSPADALTLVDDQLDRIFR